MVDDGAPQSPDALRDWLRELKAASGASFADIARAIGEEERTVKRWMPEKGRPTVPSGDALLRLLDYFGVTMTPPAPRVVALSLLGEIRGVQSTLRRLESGEGGERRLSLPEIDLRLESLADSVAEVAELLKPLAAQQEPARGARKPGSGEAAR